MADITMGQLASKIHLAAEKIGTIAQQKMETLAQVAVGHVKSEIQNMHAVDTGTMLNSTQAEKVGNSEWLIGPTVYYAPYVALGTSRMEARPFHITAARLLKNDVKEVFKGMDLGL